MDDDLDNLEGMFQVLSQQVREGFDEVKNLIAAEGKARMDWQSSLIKPILTIVGTAAVGATFAVIVFLIEQGLSR